MAPDVLDRSWIAVDARADSEQDASPGQLFSGEEDKMRFRLGTFAGIVALGGPSLVALVGLVGSAGCGGDGSSGSAALTPPADGVYPIQFEAATHAGLPTCTNALSGTVGYVAPPAAGSGLFECELANWLALPCNVTNAGDVAYAPNGTSGTSTLLTCTAGTWTAVALPQGPQGATGATGPAGPMGPQGPAGAPGAAGTQTQVGAARGGNNLLSNGAQNFIDYVGSFTAKSTGACVATVESFISGVTTSDAELDVVANVGSGAECGGNDPPCLANALTDTGCAFPAANDEAISCTDTAGVPVTAGQTVQLGCFVGTGSAFVGGLENCTVTWVCSD